MAFVDDYNPINFVDLPSETTPIDANNLNKMDKQIKKLTTFTSTIDPEEVEDKLSKLKEDIVDVNNVLGNTTYKQRKSTDSTYQYFQISFDGFNFVIGNTYTITIDNAPVTDTHFDVMINNIQIGIVNANITHSVFNFTPTKNTNIINLRVGTRFFTNFNGVIKASVVIDKYTESVNKIKTNESAIKDNASIINEIPIYNLLDLDAIYESGRISGEDGTVVELSGLFHSDYVKVKPNKTYHIYGAYIEQKWYAYYDSNKNFVDGMDIVVENNIGTFTTPANVHYIRFSSFSSPLKDRWYLTEYDTHFYPNGLYLPTLSRFLGTKTLIMGDSISTGTSSNRAVQGQSYGHYEKWVDILLSDNFFSRDNLTNDSIHATGFVVKLKPSDGGTWLNGENNFVQRLQYYIDNNKNTEYKEFILFGGINDFIQNIELDTFKSAVDTFFNLLVNNFPQARLLVITPLLVGANTNSIGLTVDDYSNYIKEVSTNYSIPVFDGTHGSGWYPKTTNFVNMWSYRGDTVHPNYDYQNSLLAPMIKNFIERY